MSVSTIIVAQNLSDSNGFYSITLNREQLCQAAGVIVKYAENEVVVRKEGSDVRLLGVPEDSVQSGRSMVDLALAKYVSEKTGLSIISPTNAASRKKIFDSREGISYEDYVRVMAASTPGHRLLEVVKANAEDISITTSSVEDGVTYFMGEDTDAYDMETAVEVIHASRRPARLRIEMPKTNVYNRIVQRLPKNMPVNAEDGYLYFGSDRLDIGEYAAGPESVEGVNDVLASLRTLTLSEGEVLGKLASFADQVQTPAAAPAVNGGGNRSGSYVPFPAFRGELDGQELALIEVLAQQGMDVRVAPLYKDIDTRELFGSRQMNCGNKLIKSLATQVHAFRNASDFKTQAVEDTVFCLAEILTKDGQVNQAGGRVKQPLLAAIVLLCRSPNLYRLERGASLGADGKHYSNIQ